MLSKIFIAAFIACPVFANTPDDVNRNQTVASDYTIPTASTYTTISFGDHHSCGLTVSGLAECWGDNTYGQTNPPPAAFVQINVGAYHSCGLTAAGTALCWGDNFYGQSTPPAGPFSRLSADKDQSCGIRPDNTVICWGSDTYAATTSSPKKIAMQATSKALFPDLVASKVSAPTKGVVGNEISVSATMKNQGKSTADGARLSFYFSKDAKITRLDINANRYGCDVPALASNATHVCSGNIPVPAILNSGTYYVGAYADDYQVVTEKTETTNGRAAATKIKITGGSSGSGNKICIYNYTNNSIDPVASNHFDKVILDGVAKDVVINKDSSNCLSGLSNGSHTLHIVNWAWGVKVLDTIKTYNLSGGNIAVLNIY